jgi:hypothetical protein
MHNNKLTTYVIVSENGTTVTRTNDYADATRKAEGLAGVWKMDMAVYTLNATFPATQEVAA